MGRSAVRVRSSALLILSSAIDAFVGNKGEFSGKPL
jgi:hypothetical protein